MKHYIFDRDRGSYPICFAVPAINVESMRRYYIDPFGLDPNEILFVDLHQRQGKKKTSVTEMREYVQQELLPAIQDMGVEYVLCADPGYYKILSGYDKADAQLGYVTQSPLGPWKIIYIPNYRAVFYDPPKVQAKIAQGIEALIAHAQNQYKEPGTGLLRYQAYPKTLSEIAEALDILIDMDVPLTIDIEGFSLKHYNAGIGTISFAWSDSEGIAFAVDYVENFGASEAPFGRQVRNEPVRLLLRDFFERLNQRAIYHHITYDVYVLIYQLYMKDLLDTEGLLRGMDIMLKNWDCTRLISYLATNSCAGNSLSLKDQAQEYAGNYAMSDITDIRNIKLDNLLRYNLIDACSTHYVYHKNWPILVQDDQENFYNTIFKPATLDIIQMQLTGIPLDMERVKEVKVELLAAQAAAEAILAASPIVIQYNHHLREKWVIAKNEKLKKKRVTLADAPADVVFNPGSAPQLQELIYDLLELPVLMMTKTGLPSTKAADLKDLKNHTENADVLAFLDALLDYAGVAIINETFIPAFESAQLGPDGWYYLFGSFTLGGTITGRLSSSDPNLQNLPATSKYAKLIKSCVVAPPGWLFIGLDFSSLEDRISALTTRDPTKLKVYLDGYDGHSLRAYAYYTEQMPDIDPNSVESINSIQKKYKPLRDKSKNPTFTLTYQGTWRTLVVKYKFTEELAKQVEERYHALYAVSDQWIADRLDEAAKVGYVTVAFGLRVRTPLLAQVIRGSKKTPYEATAEGRSAGNALGQSWCMLNNRAASEFMSRVRQEQHRLSVRPCAQIHDAQYYLVREDVSLLAYVNVHLVKAVQWQEDPLIAHDKVKITGELSVFYPSWLNEIVIPNGATEVEIFDIINAVVS
jgi:DNA polymerase-1